VSRDLADVLTVPPKAAKNHDVSLIVLPLATDSFKSFLEQSALRFPLLQFSYSDEGFHLRKVLFKFDEDDTEEFFAKPMEFKRVPLRYLPFALDKVLHQRVVTEICRHLLSLVRKEVAGFTVEEFCSGYVPIWDFVDARKRGQICRVTKEVIRALLRRSVGRDLVKMAAKDPPSWEIITGTRPRNMRSIKKALEGFIAEVKAGVFQGEFDLDEIGHFEVRYKKVGEE
jgi:hypothetical protein